MTTIHVQLDEATFERIRQKAVAAGQTPDEYLAHRAREEAASEDPLVGWLADEPELADAIDEASAQSRCERFGSERAINDD